MLGAWVLENDGAVAFFHHLADAGVDLLRIHVGSVDLAPLVEVDIEGIGQTEAVMLLAEVDIKEDLLRAAGQLLGVHAHVMGLALLRRGRRSR